jgi:hypothetical protein
MKFDDQDVVLPPVSSADSVLEQYRVAAAVAVAIRDSKVVGEGTTYQVDISGVANPGHPNGDAITVTVTNKN